MLNATFVDTSVAVSLLHQFCSKEFILALSKFYLSGFIGTLFFLPINIWLFVKKKINCFCSSLNISSTFWVNVLPTVSSY